MLNLLPPMATWTPTNLRDPHPMPSRVLGMSLLGTFLPTSFGIPLRPSSLKEPKRMQRVSPWRYIDPRIRAIWIAIFYMMTTDATTALTTRITTIAGGTLSMITVATHPTRLLHQLSTSHRSIHRFCKGRITSLVQRRSTLNQVKLYSAAH